MRVWGVKPTYGPGGYKLVDQMLLITVCAFVLYGLVALFAERCEKVREDTYPDCSYIENDDYDLTQDIVVNPSFKNMSCNIWHREEDE